ncbi:MAG: sugar porter family MFS transporter [Phycisphaerae bacterium]
MSKTGESGSVLYVVLLALVAALGGLLFGYDTAVISGATEFLRQKFALDENWEGWAAACTLLGCMLGAGMAGTLSDRFGRKKTMLVAAILFALSALGAALPRNLNQFVIARIIGGLGIGIASMMSPMYIAEVSPSRIRGRLISVNQFAIIFGMLVVYFVNAYIARRGGADNQDWNIHYGWRWMFASGVFPAVLFFILLFFVPESPRWLVSRGHDQRAESILARIGGRAHAGRQIGEIREALLLETGSLGQLFAPQMRLPLLIGIGLAVLQQITGINIVLYYAPKIFSSTGLKITDAIGHTVLVGAVNLAFTVIAIWVVDGVGRKPLLLTASAGMGLSLLLLGEAFRRERFHGPWVLVLVLAYVASFAIAMGPVVWVVIAEIFPTGIRGRAMAVATVCLWFACFMVTQTFPRMLKHLGGNTFFIYAVMCAVCFLFVAVFVPETKGKSLEDIERGWMRRENR